MKNIDYKGFEPKKTDSAPGGSNEHRWWKTNKGDRAQSIMGVVSALGAYDSKRQTQYQISSRLYGNTTLMGVSGLAFNKVASNNNSNKDRISYNVVQSCIDTVAAKIGKNRPRPFFLTSGGDYRMQRKAKKLNKFVDGIFYENNTYRKGVQAFLDSAVWGDGFIQVYEKNNRVTHDRVMPQELYVDWVEAFDGAPRQLHRIKNVDRQVLKEMFPSKTNAIERAQSADIALADSMKSISDQVTVVESWHLPSGPDATDGLHCIVVEDDTLFEEEWTNDFFPFAKLPWCPRLTGFWAQSAAEQIQNIQLEINKLLWVIQRSYHLAGSFKVLLANGSKVVKEHLNNDIGAIINYTGAPPQYITPPIVPPEIYQHLATLKQAAYEQVGISQLSASAQKPAGLDSGKALREFNDIESERFMTIGHQYENFYLDLAKLSISVAKNIAAREGGYPVKSPDKRSFDKLDWKDIDMDEEDYVMKCFPVSQLPEDPAGRLQTVQEYMQAGIISPRTGRILLDFPDLESVENRENAPEEYILQCLDKMVEEGEYTTPEPQDDLACALKTALDFYAQSKMQGVEEEKLELVRTYMEQVQAMSAAAMAAAQPQQPVPQASPMPAPQSDLIQNVPGGMPQ